MAVMDYRTRDGLAGYSFSIEFQSGAGWRVYIIFQPFPRRHDDSLKLPNQSIDGNGRCYVDWSGKLDRLGDAKAVAALWIELAELYHAPKNKEALPQLTQIVSPPRWAPMGLEPGHQDCSATIPYFRPVAESLSDLQESRRPGREVA